MKRFIGFGSIDQFRTVIKNVQHTAMYQGQDENDEAIYNRSVEMPKIVATGSEKIHGTNAAVCYSHYDGFWVQSRKNIITPEKDNAGCAFQAYANQSEWMSIIGDLSTEYDINCDTHIISIYFEWAGGNIQKNSALTGLDKRAMIFQYFKVSPIEPQMNNAGQEEEAIWLETSVDDSDFTEECVVYVDNEKKNIFNIMKFPQVQIEIDFNEPLMSQNKMIEMVETLEKNSPVGQKFGIKNNIGEGYVFTFEYKGSIQRFKVKGEEHSKGTGKVKTLKPVDSVKEQKKIDFVNLFACTESRLNQMWTEIVHSVHNGDENLMTRKNMGPFLSLVVNDVIKEESDKLFELRLEPNEVKNKISKVSRNFFDSKLNEIAGL